MKINLLKLSKFISSRLIYFIIGIFLAISVTYVYASWDTAKNDNVQLQASDWNDMIDAMKAMDTTVANINTKVNLLPATGGGCIRTLAYSPVVSVGPIACPGTYSSVYVNTWTESYAGDTTSFCENWCCK